MDQFPADTLRIPVDALTGLVADVFVAAGCDARGGRPYRHASRRRQPRRPRQPRRGARAALCRVAGSGLRGEGQDAEIVTDGGAFALLDGKWGFGQTVAPQAVALGIARAQQHGVAVTALRNAGHIGRVGDYAEQAIAAGLISIHFVNVAGSVLVAPFGGVERRFSTNPVAIGVPLPGRPLVLDFATSLVAEGKVLVASSGGKKLPEGALIEPDGRLSTDPHTLYGPYDAVGPRNPSNGKGAIRAFGEHKGSGLAFMCEMLAGCLTAGGTSGPINERGRIANGLLSIFLSPKHFGTQAEFERMGLVYADWISACQPADPAQPVLLPGEPEAQRRADRTTHGVPLPQKPGRTSSRPRRGSA